jgi:hypothetical protein
LICQWAGQFLDPSSTNTDFSFLACSFSAGPPGLVLAFVLVGVHSTVVLALPCPHQDFVDTATVSCLQNSVSAP